MKPRRKVITMLIILIVSVIVTISCNFKSAEEIKKTYFGDHGYHEPWTKTGYIDSCDCNVFIVNDSLIIKPVNDKVQGIRYFVFENGVVIKKVYTFRRTHNADNEMINYLQWRYLDYLREKKIKYRTGCLKLD